MFNYDIFETEEFLFQRFLPYDGDDVIEKICSEHQRFIKELNELRNSMDNSTKQLDKMIDSLKKGRSV